MSDPTPTPQPTGFIRQLCEDGNGAYSTMRALTLLNGAISLPIIGALWIWAAIDASRLPVAQSATLALGTQLASMLTAKIVQNNQENKQP
jgi:hypothetical protein